MTGDNESVYRFFPDRRDVALFCGLLIDRKRKDPGAIVLTSTSSRRVYDEDFRDYLTRISKLNAWDDAVFLTEFFGGDESDLVDLADNGLVRRVPGQLTASQFLKCFDDLALVSTTAVATRSLSKTSAILKSPLGRLHSVTVPRPLYELLRRSTGDRSVAHMLTAACRDTRSMGAAIKCVVDAAPNLLNNRVAGFVRSESSVRA